MYVNRGQCDVDTSPTCTCTMHSQGLGASLLDIQGANTSTAPKHLQILKQNAQAGPRPRGNGGRD